MKLEIIKGLILTALFLTTLFFSMLPLILINKIRRTSNPARRHSYQHIISYLSCFGGGVFLGTCFLDLFPEVHNQLTKSLSDDRISSSYPVAEFVMIFGFLLVLIIEQIVLSCKDNTSETQNLLEHSHAVQDEENEEQISHSIHEDPSSHSNLRSLLLVFALSLHSTFEGLAIGLQADMNATLQIFVAVMIHKSIIAFTLGLNLVQSKLYVVTCVLCNCLFSIMSPLGIGMGIAIDNAANGIGMSLTNGILQGIACGSFLYVIFFEILPHELNSGVNHLLKLLFVILGFAGISIIVGFHPD